MNRRVPRIRITTSDHGMIATAVVTAGPPLDADQLRAAIAEARVQHGLDDAAVAGLAASARDAGYAGSVVIARGTPVQPGADGHFLAAIPAEVLPGEPRGDGSLDYHERHFLLPVAEGTRIGRCVPATAGTPGRDVLGAEVAARPGKPLALRLGAGVRMDGSDAIATRSGVLLRDPRQLDVVPLYSHAGDVDYASGGLHTDGSLEVKGDVYEGFAVTAKGDVRITGALLGGTVAAAGHLRVDQGVLGTTASASAGGNVHCRHATSATVLAGDTVVLGDQASHCRIRAEHVVATAGRGVLFGGETRVRSTIVVREAGTDVGARTDFALGDVTDDAAAAVAATNADSKVAARMQERFPGNGAPAGKAMRGNLRAADKALDAHLRTRLRQRELLAGARLDVDGKLHPGVRVAFGDRVWVCDRVREHIRLRWSGDDETIREENLP